MTVSPVIEIEEQNKPFAEKTVLIPVEDNEFVHSFESSDDYDLSKALIGKRPLKTVLLDLAIWLAITAYAVAIILKGSQKAGFTLAILVYAFLTIRIAARHISFTQLIWIPLSNATTSISSSGKRFIPSRYVNLIIGVGTLVIMVLVALLAPITNPNVSSKLYRLQSFSGVIVLLALLYLASNNRKAIPWRTVSVGLLAQYIIALFVLKTETGVLIFDYMARLVTGFLEMSSLGLEFLIGKYEHNNFAVNVLPAIIFFCSFISIVYYLGGMQYVISKMGWFMMALMDTSGSESIVAAASPFVGQGESALLVRPFVEYMTRSELHSTMVSGFATISGSILLAYVNQIKDTKILLTACIMSIPASLLVSKIRYPETEESLTKGKVKIPESEEREANFLHAAGNGSGTGVQLALLIFGSLLSLYSLFKAADYLFGWFFYMIDVYDWINPTNPDGSSKWVTLELCMSYLFFPIAWVIGIPIADARSAGELMAIKMAVNEYLAYTQLHDMYFVANAIQERTFMLCTFALCGFANVASIGIQIGCLGVIAPTRKRDLAELALSAMLTGTVSTWLTAAVAGTLM